MWQRRICYLVTLVGCMVFYLVYQQWFSWLLLLTVLLLPWFSLVISYPAMRSTKIIVQCPAVARVGMPVRTSMRITCSYPAPRTDCKIRLVNSLTGERYVGHPGELVPTEHCGRITITTPRPVVYDYLGLFCKRLPESKSCAVYVFPKLVESEIPVLGRRNDSVSKPKPGGTVAEEHELRLYRPGDSLRHIHWKLTAKTGKLIYREAMEQAKKGHVLTLSLSGTPEQLDRKLGQILWCSQMLISEKRAHQIRCHTGKGVVTLLVTNKNSLDEGMRTLLSMPPADTEVIPESEDAFWVRGIGGDSHG